MKIRFLGLALLTGLSLISHLAIAEIYKNVDSNGHITYSNMPSRGATRLDLGEAGPRKSNETDLKPFRTKLSTPSDFPRVDKTTQLKRDDKRKQILLSELETEKKALMDAKKAHIEHESSVESIKNSPQKNSTDIYKAQEKSRLLQTDVDTHQSNIQLLQKELANLR